MRLTATFEYLKNILFIILFAWISFFPEPIQARYKVHTIIFFSIFLLVFIFNKRCLKFIFSFKDWPLWLFLICLLSGTLTAVNKNMALKTYFQLVITFFLLFYIGKCIFLYANDRKVVFKVFCVCGLIVAFIGLLELYFRKNILYENFIPNPFYQRYITGFVRPMSTQFHPVVLGTYLLGCLPFNFLLFKQQRTLWKALGAVGIVLNIAVIILTFSRGVFLGLIATVIFYLLMQKKYWALVIFFIILVLFILSFTYLPYPFNRFGKNQMLAENRGVFSDYRFTRYAMTWRIIKEHPLAGLGFQHFRLRFYEYYPYQSKVPYEFMIPDNMYLTFLAETGIIGALGFFIFIFFLLKRELLHLKKSEEDDDRKQMLLMPMSALIGLLVNMAAYELFYWANPYMLFCLLCGFVSAFR